LPATLPPSCRRRRQAAAAKLLPPPDALRHRVVALRHVKGMQNQCNHFCHVEISDVFFALFPDTSRLSKTLVLFLHTTTVPEARGGEMAQKT
jgi:hypothetical protein